MTTRAYVASHFALELDDGKGVAGFVRSVEGGGVKAEILTHNTGANYDAWRQLGKMKYDDITVQVGMAMSRRFYDWIQSFFTFEGSRRSGAILAADFGYAERARRSFQEALITEVGMPALDGSDKNPCYMTVKFTPERLVYEAGKGGKLSAPEGMKRPQKRWLAANFRFTIDGLMGTPNRVTKIDGFTIKQQILDYPYGHGKDSLRVPGRLEYPNISFYLPEVDSKPFVDEVKKRIQDREPRRGTGYTAAITYLASDNTTELGTIKCEGVDVASIEPEKLESSADNLHRVKVQLQVEKMKFEYSSDAVAA